MAPGRVFALLFAMFVAGGALAGGALFVVLDGQRAAAIAERDDAVREYEDLQAKFEAMQSAGTSGSAQAGAVAPEPTDSEPAGIPLRITPPTDAETALRIAVFRSKKPIRMEGEGLIVVQSASKAIPMPGGELLARASGSGVFVEGVGTLPAGTRIENRLGPIKVGKREYPGAIEIQREGDGLLLINELELEKYLLGVLAGEVPASWPIDAKKAQAVVARSYALMQRAEAEGTYHLEATVADQVYKGTEFDSTITSAVTATYGEVLLQDGLLVSTFFHSACGGSTEDPGDVWPDRATHGNRIVECGFCDDSPYESWSVDLSPEELVTALQGYGHPSVREVTGIHVAERTNSDRIRKLEIATDVGSVPLSGQDFREMVGYMRVKSAGFDVQVAGNAFRLTGTGFGHGVGMCQHGARGMAAAGEDYRAILERYFPAASVAKIY